MLTGKDYKQEYLDFIRSEQRRSNIMTLARIQHCLRKLGIDFGYYNGERLYSKTVMNRDSALFLYNNHFCLILKSEGVSFSQAIQELEENFQMVDNFITEKNLNSHFKYEFIPKKIESHMTNFIVYDLETNKTDRTRPYNMSFYRLSKIAGRYERDPTQEEFKKSIIDTLVFVGDNCVGIALDFCLKLKEEEYKDNIGKVLENNIQLHAHNGKDFDTWIVLNNLHCDKRIVNIQKNGKCIIELKVINGYFEKKK